MGIRENEAADQVAANLQEEHMFIYYKYWIPIIKNSIEENWARLWQSCNEKLRKIKQNTLNFLISINLNRKKRSNSIKIKSRTL